MEGVSATDRWRDLSARTDTAISDMVPISHPVARYSVWMEGWLTIATPNRAFPELIHGLFDAPVLVVSAPICGQISSLTSGERAIVSRAVDKRKTQFATGRILARRLLSDLGYFGFELLRDKDRVPVWPEDVVGSISHTEGLCVVAIASARNRVGIGIDVEPDQPVKAGVEKIVCRTRERDWVESGGASEYGRRCRAVFCVKEAVYKSFFPRLRRVWGFQEVGVDIDLDENTFRAQLPEDADRPEVEGRILRREGWILSAVDYT